MKKAIEIVQAMYDETEARYVMAGDATLERIETLKEVLGALRKAMKGGAE